MPITTPQKPGYKQDSGGALFSKKQIEILFIITIIAFAIFAIAGNSSNSNEADTQKDTGAGKSQGDSLSANDPAETERVLEEMSLKFQNPELVYKFYSEGHKFQHVPISKIPSRIILRNLLITDLHVEGDYLVGHISNLQDNQPNINGERMSFRYIGSDGNNLPSTGAIQVLTPATEVEAEHFSVGSPQINLPEIVNIQFRTQIPKQAIIALIQ